MKRPSLIISLLICVLALVFNVAVCAGTGRPATEVTNTQQGDRTANSKADNNPSVDQQRLEFERQKFASEVNLENEKIKLEREKLATENSKIPWTAFSTVVPLLAALFTVGYSVWSFRKQNQQLNEQRRIDAGRVEKQRAEDAQLQFELKTAEIAFAGETPLAVRDRAKALKAMFANRLSDNFLSDYDPREFGEREGNIESKKFFLDLLLKYPEQQFETLSFWKELFPGDVNWLVRVNLSPHEARTNVVNEDSAPQAFVESNNLRSYAVEENVVEKGRESA